MPVKGPGLHFVADLISPAPHARFSFAWNTTSNIFHQVTNYRIHEGNSNFPFTDASVIWEGTGADHATVPRSSHAPGYFWVSARVGTPFVYTPDTLGLLAAPLWLNRDAIEDPEFQVFPTTRAWDLNPLGLTTTALTSLESVNSSQFATGGMVRTTFNGSNAQTGAIGPTIDFRSVARPGQFYGVEIRWRRTNSLFSTVSGGPASSLDPYMRFDLFQTDSDMATHFGGFQAREQLWLPMSTYPGSKFYLANGFVQASSNASHPWFRPVLRVGARLGTVEIDRFAIFPVSSVQISSFMTCV